MGGVKQVFPARLRWHRSRAVTSPGTRECCLPGLTVADLDLAPEVLLAILPEAACRAGIRRGISDKAAGRELVHRQPVEQYG